MKIIIFLLPIILIGCATKPAIKDGNIIDGHWASYGQYETYPGMPMDEYIKSMNLKEGWEKQ